MDNSAEKMERDIHIDAILIYMNSMIESQGALLNEIVFSFEEGDDDLSEITKRINISYPKVVEALNVCIARKYVKQTFLSEDKYNGLMLTESGQGRAISVIEANKRPEKQSNGIHIGNLNSYGNTQIGDNNVQNIEQVFASILERIDASDAPDSEKREAKDLLKKFLEHPLTSAAVGSAASIITGIIGG